MNDAELLRRARIALMVLGAVLGLAALLPWAQVLSPNGVAYSVNGMDRDNDAWVTLSCGVVVIAAAAFATQRLLGLVSAGAGSLAFGFGIENWLNMRRVAEHAAGGLPALEASIGLGLWVTVLGGLVVIGVSVWVLGFERGSGRRLRARYG